MTISLVLASIVTGGFARATEAVPAVRLPVAVSGASESTDTVIVERGDNLWKISAERLKSLLQREPRDEEVSPYWLSVIAENRDSIKSGDPDLIYPGEAISMPDLSGRP